MMYYKALCYVTFPHKRHQKGPEALQIHTCNVSGLGEDKGVKKDLFSCLEASSGTPGTLELLCAAHPAFGQVC